ncbi:MAG: hypothetical protein JW991_03925 [Candidatus Pacebacteria bacterium]|nr:hypothetical protein [Candidatus Paceibacterota bacterium]
MVRKELLKFKMSVVSFLVFAEYFGQGMRGLAKPTTSWKEVFKHDDYADAFFGGLGKICAEQKKGCDRR